MPNRTLYSATSERNFRFSSAVSRTNERSWLRHVQWLSDPSKTRTERRNRGMRMDNASAAPEPIRQFHRRLRALTSADRSQVHGAVGDRPPQFPTPEATFTRYPRPAPPRPTRVRRAYARMRVRHRSAPQRGTAAPQRPDEP